MENNKEISKIIYKTEYGDFASFELLKGNLWEVTKNGYRAASAAEHMDLRNRAFESGDKFLIEEVCDSDTPSLGTSFVIHPDGRCKIVPRSSNLRLLTPEIDSTVTGKYFNGGGIVLESDEAFRRFDETPEEIYGTQLFFSQDEIDRYCKKTHSNPEEVVQNPIWLALAEGDQERLGTYAEHIFFNGSFNTKDSQGEINDYMGFSIKMLDHRVDYEREIPCALTYSRHGSNLVSQLGHFTYGRWLLVDKNGQSFPKVAKNQAERGDLTKVMHDLKPFLKENDVARMLYESLSQGNYNI